MKCEIKELRSQAKKLESIVRIGKSGLNSSFIGELNNVLKKRKLVKIRFLNSSFEKKDKKELIKELVQNTKSELIEAVGNIAVLYKK